MISGLISTQRCGLLHREHKKARGLLRRGSHHSFEPMLESFVALRGEFLEHVDCLLSGAIIQDTGEICRLVLPFNTEKTGA